RLADDPPPTRGSRRRRPGPVRRPAVAREHRRGLPDRPRARAGADRSCRTLLAPTAPERRRDDPRPVAAREQERAALLAGREPAPHAPQEHRRLERARTRLLTPESGHAGILAAIRLRVN